jgi:hypothetical protein
MLSSHGVWDIVSLHINRGGRTIAPLGARPVPPLSHRHDASGGASGCMHVCTECFAVWGN